MASASFDDTALVQALQRHGQRALHVTEIAEALGLSIAQRRKLSEALERLVLRGTLSALPGSRYRLPRDRGPGIEGMYTQHPRGFGFVSAGDGGGDVYIAATATLGAMHGDLVRCTATEGPRGRDGVITQVLTRRSALVPGTLRVRGHGSWVEPDDARIRGPIVLVEPFAAPDGAAVICEITQWPAHPGESPQGRVREALGDPGDLAVEVRKVLLREGVEEDFPEDAAAEGAALPGKVPEAELEGREDLRGVDLVTIDPDDARDHDDAIYVVRHEDGGYTCTVAIADVAHYVRPGTALDRAALQRGLSIYLPDRAIPMLPRALSSQLASLQEGEDRLVLAVIATLDPRGEVLEARLVEGVMRSRARLTYTRVARALGWTDAPADPVEPALLPLLEVSAELASLLRARRMRRGALDFDLPEGRVRFDESGAPVDIVQSRRDPGVRKAYALIEEMMLLANEAVAREAVDHDMPTVFRVHGEPDAEHLERICVVAKAYGHNLDPDEVRHPKKLSAFLRKITGKPESRVLGMLILRAMPQARYAAVNTGHFGLASPAYLHFTSPIRRYPDVVVHRGVKAHVQRGRVPATDEARAANARAAAEVSRLERRAVDVEREVLDVYRCKVAEAHVGGIFTGRVTAFSNAGVWVEIESPFLTGLLRLESLGADNWEVDEIGVHLRGARTGRHITLGDEITVELREVSIPRRTIYVELAAEARRALEATVRPRLSGRDRKGPVRPTPARTPMRKKGKHGGRRK